MLTLLALLGVLVALFIAGVLATSDRSQLADATPDSADVLPPGPLRPQDVVAVRFAVAARGYRMAEVDDVLDRLADELEDRDRRLALLEATVEGGVLPAPDAPSAAPVVEVHEAAEEDLPLSSADPVSSRAVRPSGSAAEPADPTDDERVSDRARWSTRAR